ncbi:MAG: potassium-transporting ATPase subunit F [Heteroscytonema crispum UTEX LB 1556]
MKEIKLPNAILPKNVTEGISYVWFEWRRQKFPLIIFLGLCLNLIIAPIVYAATDKALERRSAWALGILGLVTLALVIYLFDVVFRPERY